MREKLARWLALLTGVLLVAAALGFAAFQNRQQAAPAPPAPAPSDDPVLTAGKRVFEEQGCMLCHSVGEEGDKQHPLDGAGSRLSAAQIRDFIAPPESMRASLSAEVFETKQQFRALPAQDLDALAAYLGSLR